MSIRLATGDDMVGCLNLYGRERDSFEDEAVDIAAVYARIASVVMLKTREVDGPRSALQARHIISTAQGLLMQQYGISLNRSFEVLRRLSNENNVKLRVLALEIVRQHDPSAWVGEQADTDADRPDLAVRAMPIGVDLAIDPEGDAAASNGAASG